MLRKKHNLCIFHFSHNLCDFRMMDNVFEHVIEQVKYNIPIISFWCNDHLRYSVSIDSIAYGEWSELLLYTWLRKLLTNRKRCSKRWLSSWPAIDGKWFLVILPNSLVDSRNDAHLAESLEIAIVMRIVYLRLLAGWGVFPYKCIGKYKSIKQSTITNMWHFVKTESSTAVGQAKNTYIGPFYPCW